MNLIQGDCLEKMKDIPDKSVDMILCDLPYGRTNLEWDIVIDFETLWEQYERIIKDNGAILLFGVNPFSSDLINSNKRLFRYELIWEKSRISNPFRNKKEPSKIHEQILVFYKNQPTYNPLKFKIDEKYVDKRNSINNAINKGQFNGKMIRNKDTGERQPQSIIFFNSHWSKGMHSTQKPVALCEYLIKTYTNEGDLVLDNTMGSGTTGVACINKNRKFIGIELDEKYFKIAEERISSAFTSEAKK